MRSWQEYKKAFEFPKEYYRPEPKPTALSESKPALVRTNAEARRKSKTLCIGLILILGSMLAMLGLIGLLLYEQLF